jgi:glycolate oxidase subunit GlcD
MMSALAEDLTRVLGQDRVVAGSLSAYAADATEHEGLRGEPHAVVQPQSPEEVALIVAWAYRNDEALVPRGGGTGFSGGAVPVNGGVVVDLSRMARVRSFDPELWRMHVDAGVLTGTVRRLAREHGLLFPPDPGAAEQSQIGGNIATNAGGPHAFKYGATGAWVTGIEAVVAPGEIIRVGGAIRKDVAGYDIRGLLVGSEGTLAIITGAWLRLIPAPEMVLPVAAAYDTVQAGCAAIESILANGFVAAAVEFVEGAALTASRGAFPTALPEAARFLVVAETDGTAAEAAAAAEELRELLQPNALLLHTPTLREEISALWRWREGVSLAVSAQRGGKVSEDIVVPLDRLRDAIDATNLIGQRFGLEACSWGHAGDGNLHSTFLINPEDDTELNRAHQAARALHELAVDLGGSISGEHGIGWLKRDQLHLQWNQAAIELHHRIKATFDPKGLFNPGKKT